MGENAGIVRHVRLTAFLAYVCRPGIWALAALVLSPEVVTGKDLIIAVKSVKAGPYTVALQGFQEALSRRAASTSIQEYDLEDGSRGKGRILSEIRNRRPSLIVTLGSPATAIIHGEVKDVPVVFCMVLNPVDSGFVQSMQSSGNNLTGASLDIPTKLQFETLKAVVPSIKKVGVIYSRKETSKTVRSAAKAAREVGLELIDIPVKSAGQVQRALDELDKMNIHALWSVADSTVFSSSRSVDLLLRRTLQSRIAFMGLSAAFVKAGALLALSIDYKDVGVQCGELAAQVLGGHLPSSLPIAMPRRVTLYVNLNVAKAIGVNIPARTLEQAVILR